MDSSRFDGHIFLIGSYHLVILSLLGSLIALFLNWQPSKVFMGDGGSTFLALFSRINISLETWIVAFKRFILMFHY